MSHNNTVLYRPKIVKHEESIHRRLASHMRDKFPHIDFNSDWAAGAFLSKNQARARASLQSGRGWSDIFIAYPSRGYHGLFIELKKDGTSIYVTRGKRKGKLVADEQIQIEAAFLNRKNSQGYLARFAVGFDAASRLLDWYLEVPDNAEMF